MKLSDNEARLLACAELDAEIGLEALAKKARVKASTAGYCLRSLEERELIRLTPLLNLNYCGYIYLGIYFSLASQHRKEPQRLLEYLAAKPIVTWLAEFGGDFQYGLALCVRDIYEARQFLDQLAKDHPGLLFDKSLVLQFEVQHSGRGYLAGQKLRGKPLLVGRAEERRELDDLDRRILKEMTRVSFRSRRQLAETIGAPAPTVDTRVKKLRAAGIIAGYIYEFDCSKIGMQSHTLLLYCKGITSGMAETLMKYASTSPAITHCYNCLGNWDFELNAEVREPRELMNITQELYELFGGSINMIKALLRYRELKTMQVPF